jgi:exonuclease SbcC
MKPIKLELTAFGPYLTKQVVDFTQFYEDGLFLIRGETGSGKTTILDAMSFALFNKIPGARGKALYKSANDVAVNVRPANADDANITTVTFEVELSGKVFRFTRTPKQVLAGGQKLSHKATVEKMENGTWVALATKIEEVQQISESYIGMDADQFSQLILLPQGKFDSFLRAGSKEREEILSAVFPIEKYELIQKWFINQRKEAKDEFDNTTSELEDLETRVSETVGDEKPEDMELVAWLSSMANAATKEMAEVQKTVEPLEAIYVAALAQLNEAANNSKALKDFNAAKDKKDKAEAALAQMTITLADQSITQPYSQSLPILCAKLTTEVTSLTQAIESSKSIARDAKALDAAKNSAKVAKEQVTLLEKEVKKLQARQVVLREHLKTEKAIAAKIKPLEKQSSQLEQWIENLGELDQLKTQKLAIQAKVKKATDDVEALVVRLEKAKEAENADLAAQLAQSLQAGSACLVCGSLDHPKPAKPKVSSKATAEIDTLQAKIKIAEGLVQTLSKDVATLEGQIKAISSKIPKDSTPGDLAKYDKDHAKVLAAMELIEEELAAFDDTRDELDTISEEIEEALESVKEWQVQKQDSEIEQTKLATSISERKNLLTKGFDVTVESERLKEINSRIRTYTKMAEDSVSHEQTVTASVATMEALEEQAKQATDDLEPLKQAELVAKADIDQAKRRKSELDKKINRLQTLLPKIHEAQSKSSNAQEALAQWQRISSLVEGTEGRKVTLASFYIGQRLKQVAAAASSRLLEMSSGQYSFEHDETIKDANGSKSGLALLIRDEWQGESRGAETLSGGEGFMASLSLALGLADVVSAEVGGRRLESLFVDEGFGSLDDDHLNEVMDILDGLREHGRLIGVVSHVAAMKDRIPKQLIITKSQAGSTVGVN